MSPGVRLAAITIGLAVLPATTATAQPTAAKPAESPRPGLTARQAEQAIGLARDAMRDLRGRTEGASEPKAERLDAKGEDGAPKPAATSRAVVTSYRYFDDLTVFSTIDLETGKIVDVQAVQHLPTPLSDGEYEEAIGLAREGSDEVRRLYERFGDQLTVYPQFSQYTLKGDARRHRVVHLNYRVGKRDLSYPRPEVDLTTRKVEVPAPEAEPKAPRRRGTENN
jgi:hypothetical protein